jgi:HAMP domain-containing protein
MFHLLAFYAAKAALQHSDKLLNLANNLTSGQTAELRQALMEMAAGQEELAKAFIALRRTIIILCIVSGAALVLAVFALFIKLR